MSIREAGINDTIRQYGDERGTFTGVFTGVHLHSYHYFINSYENNQSILFANLYDVNMNISVAPYMFLNWNRTWAKLNLKFGDVVQFRAFGELYRMGQRTGIKKKAIESKYNTSSNNLPTESIE